VLITYSHKDSFIEFSYSYGPTTPILLDNIEQVEFKNSITIYNYSDDLKIDITMGKVKLGNAIFDLDFVTTGLTETLAVSGQFHMAVTNLLEN